ncbi:unnamed protein product [Symbiodinium natans]|uniref:EF-hand domain-containing protein n=1 Tax=Symbiodinium natans TaxID=878477 RepID=A0A812PVC1_9DINO|nr:unnamed protein product [Symbiodinium natans]
MRPCGHSFKEWKDAGTGPVVSVGVPTVLPGLDEALYREAEERKHRQQLREQEAWFSLLQQSQPKLGRTSKALCHARLERELRAAFCKCAPQCYIESPAQSHMLAIPRVKLGTVLEEMDFLSARDEQVFCEKLALLLDREETGMIQLGRLLEFLLTALDTVAHQPDRPSPSLTPLSLEDECFHQLEWQLSRAFTRMLSNRHCRATTQSCHRRALEHEGAAPEEVPQPQKRPQRPLSARKPVSRCHLLYHQAIFAAREGAQLEDEIKQLKELEEMRECTFRPQLVASFRSFRPSPRPQVRNFDATVARMKNAHKQHQEKRERSSHIPSGENYERLRRLGMQPFSCAFERSGREKPLVYVDVKVGPGRTGRIGVHEGDDLAVLSRNFAKTFQLDKAAQERLEQLLHQAYEQVR